MFDFIRNYKVHPKLKKESEEQGARVMEKALRGTKTIEREKREKLLKSLENKLFTVRFQVEQPKPFLDELYDPVFEAMKSGEVFKGAKVGAVSLDGDLFEENQRAKEYISYLWSFIEQQNIWGEEPLKFESWSELKNPPSEYEDFEDD